jgi:hypothetical protein
MCAREMKKCSKPTLSRTGAHRERKTGEKGEESEWTGYPGSRSLLGGSLDNIAGPGH